MTLSRATLTRQNADTFAEILPDVWDRRWSPQYFEAFFQWRYLDRPNGETLGIMDGARCAAILDSFRRPYLIDGEVVQVRETCDWYCRPEYRAAGVGLRIMQHAMSAGEPILSVGGTESTLALLPRLGWKRLPDADNFLLPVTGGTAAATLVRERYGERAERIARALSVIPLKLPNRRKRASPPDGAAVSPLQPENLALPPSTTEVGAASLLDTAEARWLGRAPKDVGHFVWLGHYLAGELVGVTCSRIESGFRRPAARILHLQSSDLSSDSAAWMLASTVEILVERGCGLIRARFSHPAIGTALTRLGFLRRPPSVALWWSAGGSELHEPVHFSLNRADDGLLPLPR